MKSKILLRICLAAMFAVGSAGVAAAAPGGSIAQGNISVYDGGRIVSKLTGKNPVMEGSLLVCDGKCMVSSNGISIMAEDQAAFAVKNETGRFDLLVRKGHVEFTITDNSRKIAFFTPDGAYSEAEVIFNASTDPVVRGYMDVTDKGTELGVREGKMVFSTADGAKMVDASNKILLAMAEVPAGAGAAGAAAGGGSTLAGITTGAVVAGVATVGVATAMIVSSNNDDNNDQAAAGATPPTSASPNQ
ncbi:MAG TPA: hypothetical protein ENI88_02115 [Desulfobulbus sp.]|nr:hypothetical protein [Desulfobulbus sp.]